MQTKKMSLIEKIVGVANGVNPFLDIDKIYQERLKQ